MYIILFNVSVQIYMPCVLQHLRTCVTSENVELHEQSCVEIWCIHKAVFETSRDGFVLEPPLTMKKLLRRLQ